MLFQEQTLQYFSDSPCCAFFNSFYDEMKRDLLIGTTHVSKSPMIWDLNSLFVARVGGLGGGGFYGRGGEKSSFFFWPCKIFAGSKEFISEVKLFFYKLFVSGFQG